MPINNESIGIATEVAIAKTYNVQINPNYELRAESGISDFLLEGDYIRKIFEKENIPVPIKHIAEGQNPVDFILENNKTLSVKSNQNQIGKAAPQNIGQPTNQTYFSLMKRMLDSSIVIDDLLIRDAWFAVNLISDFFETQTS